MMVSRLAVEKERITCRKLFGDDEKWSCFLGQKEEGRLEFIDFSKGGLSSVHQRTWRASSS